MPGAKSCFLVTTQKAPQSQDTKAGESDLCNSLQTLKEEGLEALLKALDKHRGRRALQQSSSHSQSFR